MNSVGHHRISDTVAMSEKGASLAEYIPMASHAEPDPDPRETSRLGALRRALVSSARAGHYSVRIADAEDVAHEAIIKYLRQPPVSGVAEEARAFRALRDVRAEYWRRSSRRPEELTGEVLPFSSKAGDERLVEAALAIEQIAGRDARLYCQYKQEGHTHGDIARLSGWTPQRAGAAYKQVQRHHHQIASALEIKLKENHGT